jgi:hypothetical protein
MVTFGLDISHHQDAALDLARCRREGIEFVIIKSSEGSSFVDQEFAANLAEARVAGLLAVAYHYVRANATAAAQVANVARVVPRDVPVIPDVEAGSGGVALVRELVDRLRAAGYRVPLLYLPRWYWQQIGSPSLAGLPPLWSSRYPDIVVGSLADEWADVPGQYWNGYGGLGVAVLQFTSSASIAGHRPIDANAFRGTRDELAAVLGYTEMEDPLVKNLILAREDGPKVWVGDGMFRRHIADETELAGLQHWIKEKGGDPTVHGPWQDLRVLGRDVAERDAPAADVDEAALARELEARGWDGVTAEEVRDIVRAAFARAGAAEVATNV